MDGAVYTHIWSLFRGSKDMYEHNDEEDYKDQIGMLMLLTNIPF
jgi:hypothetical protein